MKTNLKRGIAASLSIIFMLLLCIFVAQPVDVSAGEKKIYEYRVGQQVDLEFTASDKLTGDSGVSLHYIVTDGNEALKVPTSVFTNPSTIKEESSVLMDLGLSVTGQLIDDPTPLTKDQCLAQDPSVIHVSGTLNKSGIIDFCVFQGDYYGNATRNYYQFIIKAEEPTPEPTPTYTLTFDLNGGTLNGQTGTITKKVSLGEVITIPDGPTHDSLTFSHWEGSKYYPGQKYTVTGDHTFKAVWENPGIMRVDKIWQDGNDQDGMRPRSVTIKLLANGEDTGKTLTLSSSGRWSGWFTELDRYDENGKRIVYTIEENSVPGYESSITGNDWEGFVVTNKRVPETVTVAGQKIWDDQEDEAAKRPDSVTIRLMKNDEEIEVRTISEADDWSWSFENLPKYERGQEIHYSLIEDRVAGYTSEVRGYDIINRLEAEPTETTTQEPTETTTEPSETTTEAPTETTTEPTEPTTEESTQEPTEPSVTPEPTTETQPSGSSKPTSTTEAGLPPTGENNAPYIWLGVLLLAAGAGLILLRRKMGKRGNY